MIKAYLTIIKPGIIFGNIITAIAGFAMASKGHIQPTLLIFTMLGLAMVIGSAGVFNNYIDREMDAKMARTQHRPFVTGTISHQDGLLFGSLLLFLGFLILYLKVNPLSSILALLGFVIYLFPYSFLKYQSVYATFIGSLAGGMPPLVGYCAVANQLDIGAYTLYLILVLWQMPHFYAIAIYRLQDYKAATIPVLPAVASKERTVLYIFFYTIAFSLSVITPTFLGLTGTFYLFLNLLLALSWIGLATYGFKTQNYTSWAFKMFAFSLLVIMGFCGSMVVNGMIE